jgi:hypothetical protein
MGKQELYLARAQDFATKFATSKFPQELGGDPFPLWIALCPDTQAHPSFAALAKDGAPGMRIGNNSLHFMTAT